MGLFLQVFVSKYLINLLSEKELRKIIEDGKQTIIIYSLVAFFIPAFVFHDIIVADRPLISYAFGSNYICVINKSFWNVIKYLLLHILLILK